MTTKQTIRDLPSEVAFLTCALKAPTLRESVGRLADRARAESWSHEELLVACLQREVAARDNVVFLGPTGTGKTHCQSRGWYSSHERDRRQADIRPGVTATRHRWHAVREHLGIVAAEVVRPAGCTTRRTASAAFAAVTR
jgi:hypothetical protein